MPSPTHSANVDSLSASQNFEQNYRRPSYSPVTPTFPDDRTSDHHAQSGNNSGFIDEPDTLPISLEENSDAIALKAALSILQLQKQQSHKDIKQLDRMKTAAKNDPEAFVEALKAGKLSKPPPQAVVDFGDGDEGNEGGDKSGAKSEETRTNFGQFPNPQNVVRCPPINWSKYHVVGESLDKLHDEQRRRPEPGTPKRDEYGRPPEHVIAAPYRPLVDSHEAAPINTVRDTRE